MTVDLLGRQADLALSSLPIASEINHLARGRFRDAGTSALIDLATLGLARVGAQLGQIGRLVQSVDEAVGVATTVRGGAAPVAQGAAGVERAIADIEAAGGRVLGREITVEAGGVRSRLDLFVQLPTGRQAFVEVKTGATARLTRNQARVFPLLWTQGGVPWGANAAAAGMTPGVPFGPIAVWALHYAWPLP